MKKPKFTLFTDHTLSPADQETINKLNSFKQDYEETKKKQKDAVDTRQLEREQDLKELGILMQYQKKILKKAAFPWLF